MTAPHDASQPLASQFFPYTRLGFTDNPFRVLTDAEWTELAIVPDDLQTILEDNSAHLQLVGEMGRGKSTILRGVAHHFKAKNRHVTFEYVRRGQRRYHVPIQTQDIAVLDEMQRLWWGERIRLLIALHRHPVRLITSSHTDLTLWFRLAGLPLVTHSINDASPEILQDILNRHLDYFRNTKTTAVHFTDGAVAYLSDCFGSDRRAIERFLYEVFQRLETPQAITADLLVQYADRIKHSPHP